MSRDFWMGLLCIPAALAAFAVAGFALYGLLWAQSTWGGYKFWPRSTKKDTIIATVAGASWVRYSWIPGWHVIVARTRPYNRTTEEWRTRHMAVVSAVHRRLDDIDYYEEAARGQD